MKKVLLIIILLALIGWSNTSDAQSGVSCDSAKIIGDTNVVYPNLSQTKQLEWYKFTALSDTMDIILSDSNKYLSTDKVIGVFLANGTCSSLSLVALDTITSITDSVLTITNAQVIKDSSYYLVIVKFDSTSTINYNLKMQYRWPFYCIDTISTPCDYIFNGDFEYYSSPPNGISEIQLACPWFSPSIQTPEYYSSKGTGGGVIAPYTIMGSQTSMSSGSGFAGIGVFVPGQVYPAMIECEYITQLLNYGGLVAGQSYDISMYVNMDSLTGMAVNNIGFSFNDTNNLYLSGFWRLNSNNPSLLWPTPITTTGYNNWFHVFFPNYIANGTEKYVTIGCFGNTPIHDTTIYSTPLHQAYYFIDNVSIKPSPFTVNAVPTICLGETLTLSTNPGTNVIWSSSPASTFSCSVCDTASTTPSAPGAIVFTATTIAGCVAGDTVTVNNCSTCGGAAIPTNTWSGGSTLTANTLYALNYNATVSGSVTLTNDIITIRPYTIITVPSGASLTLDHCHLYACDTMWQGIIVSPGGSLTIIDSSLIEDAMVAVDITSATTANNLTITNSVFNKDSVGINIDSYAATGSPYTVTGNVFTCRNLPFDTVSWPSPVNLKVFSTPANPANPTDLHYLMGSYAGTFMNFPHSSAISNMGIHLNNVGTGAVGGPYTDIIIGDGNTNADLNLFDTLLCGIYAEKSNFTCYNNTFQYVVGSLSYSYPYNGFGICATSNVPYATTNRMQVISDSANNKSANYFYDCRVGVHTKNYNDIAINHCDIRSTEQCVTTQPVNGYFGIHVFTPNITHLNINNNVITNVCIGINFWAADYTGGAYSDQQNIGRVRIMHNTIQATYGTTAPTNEYCLIGIGAYNLLDWFNYISGTAYLNYVFSSPPKINVSRNHIHDYHNGIEMFNWFNFQWAKNLSLGNVPVSDSNYIALRKIIYNANTPADAQFGIQHQMNWNGEIINNNISGYGNTDSASLGIMCNDNIGYGGPGQRVSCNYVDSLDNGIEYQGNNFTAQGSNVFENNQMNSAGKGLVLDNTGIGPVGPFSTPVNPANDNQWTGTYSGSSQYTTFTKNGADANNSCIFIDPALPSYDPLSVGACGSSSGGISYAAAGLIYGATPNGFTCNTVSSMTTYVGNNNKSLQSDNAEVRKLEQMVNDSINYSYFDYEQHINDKFKAYQLLTLQPSLKDNSTILQNFYANATNGNIGKLAKATNAIINGQGAAYINSIAPQNAIETNYKNYYLVYLHSKAGRLNTSDSTILKALIKGCPVRDGLIVYNARTLYSSIYMDFKNYTNDCEDPLGQAKMKQAKNPTNESNFSLYPNPTSSTFTIITKGDKLNSNLVVMSISDVTGKQISVNKVQLKEGSAIIDPELMNGVYFISLKDESGNIGKPQKITIIK